MDRRRAYRELSLVAVGERTVTSKHDALPRRAGDGCKEGAGEAIGRIGRGAPATVAERRRDARRLAGPIENLGRPYPVVEVTAGRSSD